MQYLPNFYDKGEAKELGDFSKAMSSSLVKAQVTIYRHLNNLYIRGPTDPSEYGEKSFVGDMPYRLPQAYENKLDKLGWMFRIYRRFAETDEPYRQRIIYAIKASTTRYGVKETLKFIFESSPITFSYEGFELKFDVEIRETFKDFFDGVSSGFNSPLRGNNTRLFGLVVYLKPKPSEYNMVRSIDYRSVIEYSDFKSFRELLEGIVAAGIKVDRVIFMQFGSGGNKGEYYAYKI